MHRRYTIFNLYIRASNQSPQSCHALNNLWKARLTDMSPGAQSMFDEWANNSEIEIMLQGGYHNELEATYKALKNIPDLPCAKFNESVEALNGACTVVTFVASPRIVGANKMVRENHWNPANVVENLSNASKEVQLKYGLDYPLTEDEIFVTSKIAFLPLAP